MRTAPVTYQIPRLERPSVEQFQREYVARDRPVILSGAMQGWRALSAWDLDYLRACLGAVNVNVNLSPDGAFKGDPETGYAGRSTSMPFSDYVDLLRSTPEPTRRGYYLQQTSIPGQLSLLALDIETPPYFDRTLLRETNFWLSPGDNLTSLHYDIAHNFLAVVRGEKRLVLFDPSQTPRLYPNPVSSKVPHLSRVDLERPDREKFPLMQEATRWECLLHPGEMLFIPVLWWHQVYSIGLTMSVNFWWRAPIVRYASRQILRLAPRLLTTRWS
jgi:hypothetical protein